MPRQQTNISALDTEALSMEPGKVFRRKTQLPALKCGQDDCSYYMISRSPKRAFYNGATAGQHNHWLEGSKLTWAMPSGSWQSNIHMQSARAVTPDEENPSTAQQAVASNDVPNIATGQWHQLNTTSETKAGCFLLNHTAQSVPIMPLVSGEAHRERCKTRRAHFMCILRRTQRLADQLICILKSSSWMKCMDQY